jgi:hypothetical protein
MTLQRVVLRPNELYGIMKLPLTMLCLPAERNEAILDVSNPELPTR